MRSQGLEAAQPRRKVRTTVPAADLGSRPDLVRRNFTANRPGEQVGGRYHLYPHLGGDRVPGDRPRLLHEESSRVRDWGDSTRHRVRYMRGDRYGSPQVPVHDRRNDPPAPGRGCQYTSEQLGDHLESYGTRPSVGRTGVCWAGAWAEVGGCDPQGTRGSIRWCIPQEARPSGILPPGSSWNTRSETTPLRPGVQDAGRGRPGAPSSKTSSLKDRFQSCPRHARQPRLSCSSICVQTSSSAIPYSP